MTDEPPMPVFTGAELALADTVILLMKVMSMHGIIDSAAAVTVFADLEARYRSHDLHTASAMADYLRRHATEQDRETLMQSHARVDQSEGEPA
jgi:hypothetical protein